MEEIKELLTVVEKLQKKYPGREFPLDGRLVGDIGEVIAAEHYDITLYPIGKKGYDAYTADNKQVQIKATFRDNLTFPAGKNNIPEYYLGLKLLEDGSFEEIYNGPGNNIWELLKGRKDPTIGNLHSISISTLKAENGSIGANAKIPKRPSSQGCGIA